MDPANDGQAQLAAAVTWDASIEPSDVVQADVAEQQQHVAAEETASSTGSMQMQQAATAIGSLQVVAAPCSNPGMADDVTDLLPELHADMPARTSKEQEACEHAALLAADNACEHHQHNGQAMEELQPSRQQQGVAATSEQATVLEQPEQQEDPDSVDSESIPDMDAIERSDLQAGPPEPVLAEQVQPAAVAEGPDGTPQDPCGASEQPTSHDQQHQQQVAQAPGAHEQPAAALNGQHLMDTMQHVHQSEDDVHQGQHVDEPCTSAQPDERPKDVADGAMMAASAHASWHTAADGSLFAAAHSALTAASSNMFRSALSAACSTHSTASSRQPLGHEAAGGASITPADAGCADHAQAGHGTASQTHHTVPTVAKAGPMESQPGPWAGDEDSTDTAGVEHAAAAAAAGAAAATVQPPTGHQHNTTAEPVAPLAAPDGLSDWAAVATPAATPLGDEPQLFGTEAFDPLPAVTPGWGGSLFGRANSGGLLEGSAAYGAHADAASLLLAGGQPVGGYSLLVGPGQGAGGSSALQRLEQSLAAQGAAAAAATAGARLPYGAPAGMRPQPGPSSYMLRASELVDLSLSTSVHPLMPPGALPQQLAPLPLAAQRAVMRAASALDADDAPAPSHMQRGRRVSAAFRGARATHSRASDDCGEEGVWVERTDDMPVSVEQQEAAVFAGLLFCDGRDSHGRPVVVVNTDAIPSGLAAADAALQYMKRRLWPLVQGPYVLLLVACCGGRRSWLLPAMWCVRAYRGLARPFRKNVRYVLVVQPSMLVRTAMAVVKPFVSKKAHAKLKQVNTLLDIDRETHGEVQVAHLGEAFLSALQSMQQERLRQEQQQQAQQQQQQQQQQAHVHVQGAPVVLQPLAQVLQWRKWAW